MHQKRVTSERHDNYFRLMTIKQSISKIEWASNDYLIQFDEPVGLQSELQTVGDETWSGKPHPTEGALGNPDGVWGPEKMLIRCSKENHLPVEWPLDLRLSIKRKTQHDGHKSEGSKYCSYVRSPAPSHSKTPHNLFEPLQ